MSYSNNFEIRNVINHEVVDQFLKLLIIKWPNYSEYISSNVKNYCYEYAPIRVANQKEIEFYKLPKKKTKYHMIILTESLMNSYMECLAFVIENTKDFVKKSFFEVYNEYNCDQGSHIILKTLKSEGQVTCLKSFSDDSQLVVLIDRQSLINESYRMSNCVHRYYQPSAKILSYRKNGKSIVTMELNNGKIQQCRLRYNQEVNLEEFPELYSWIKNPENEWFYNESVDNIHNSQNKKGSQNSQLSARLKEIEVLIKDEEEINIKNNLGFMSDLSDLLQIAVGFTVVGIGLYFFVKMLIKYV